MIICKWPDPPDDHLQEAISSKWSFVRGRIIQMIICKWPDPPDDHLQEARSSGWSFSRGRILWMIICNNNKRQQQRQRQHINRWRGWRGWRVLKIGRAQIMQLLYWESQKSAIISIPLNITKVDKNFEFWRGGQNSYLFIPSVLTVSLSITPVWK